MTVCPWEEINGFSSPQEFKKFTTWMDEQVKAGKSKIVPVSSIKRGPYWIQTWFQYSPTGETWRLVEPDPPFYGLFEKVE